MDNRPSDLQTKLVTKQSWFQNQVPLALHPESILEQQRISTESLYARSTMAINVMQCSQVQKFILAPSKA
ncbi:MAG: hypothetical protein ACRCUZ_16720, partial [Shewanella sp.]